MYKILNKYTKLKNLKYISHLDVLRMLQRAVRRAGLPALYSDGFNPHMKTAFGFPLSLGVESNAEYFELEIGEKIDIDEYINKLNNVLPDEMKIIHAQYIEYKASLMERCCFSEYIVNMEFEDVNIDDLNNLLYKLVNEGIIFNREKKNKKNKTVIKELNTKELVKSANAFKLENGDVCLKVIFFTNETGSIKIYEFMNVIENAGFRAMYYTIIKNESYDKDMKPLLS